MSSYSVPCPIARWTGDEQEAFLDAYCGVMEAFGRFSEVAEEDPDLKTVVRTLFRVDFAANVIHSVLNGSEASLATVLSDAGWRIWNRLALGDAVRGAIAAFQVKQSFHLTLSELWDACAWAAQVSGC